MTAGEREPEPPGLPLPEADIQPRVPPLDMEELRVAWTGFYDAHYHWVVRFVMHNGASLLDAQDAAQEAFAESWALLEQKPEQWLAIAYMSGWIRMVALRRYRRPPGSRVRPLVAAGARIPDLPDPSPGPGRLTVLTQTVLQALRSLDEQTRAVAAFYFDGFSTGEIARAMDLPEQKVRDVKKKARLALKIALAGHTPRARREP